jgi:hypothetical protein
MRAKEFRIILLNLRDAAVGAVQCQGDVPTSFGMHNTRAEVDHLAQALIKAQNRFS